jgi:DNA-binding NarL/FixJ family response regulator
LAFTGELAQAEDALTRLADRCRERGAENDLMAISGYQTFVAMWRGRYADADRFAADTLERAEQLGGSLVIAYSLKAVAAAYRGRADEARRYANAALDRENRCAPPLTAWARGMLAFVEVSSGRYRQAADAVAPLVALYEPFTGTEIWQAFFLPDAVEAYIGLRRYDDAEPMIAALERNGARWDRPWMLAVGKRCRAMLLAAQGDLEAALAAAQQAMAGHDRLPMPFERARTQLLLGEVQRRLRRKEAAAAALREALATFEELGSPLWMARARKDLERTAGQPTVGPAELTASELRIAGLAASGMTNRDVATTLFISVKTVEINLTRAYRKLGIRSRAQLAQRLRSSPGGSDGVDRGSEPL